MSEVKSLEHSSLMVPYEFLNKSFRSAQKVIDREVSHIISANDKIKKISSKNSTTVGDASKELDNVLLKLKALKRKTQDAINEEQERLKKCQNRLSYLKEEEMVSKKSVIAKHYRIERLLIDYFLRSGHYETAIYMTKNSNVKEHIDLELFLIARDVENSLKNKSLTLCLQWCHNNKSKLKKLSSTLALNLRIQEFVELIKKGLRRDAVAYARNHFSNDALDSQTGPEIQINVMALLAFKPDTQIKRYKEVFDENRWNLLVEQFRKEIFALYQLKSQSMLEIVLQCGLAAMKTPHCYHDEEKDQDCPVCNSLFNELAKPLPFAHSSQSQLLCSISGERMNENNRPLMLPNGNVYGELALNEMATMNNENVTCPRTQDEFEMNELKKIFIM